MWIKMGLGVVIAALALAAWTLTAPPGHIVSAPAYRMEAPSEGIMRLHDDTPLAPRLIAPEVPGHDDALLSAEGAYAYVTGRDGWFWRQETRNGKAERFARTSLIASGARFVPGGESRILSCNSHLFIDYPARLATQQR